MQVKPTEGAYKRQCMFQKSYVHKTIFLILFSDVASHFVGLTVHFLSLWVLSQGEHVSCQFLLFISSVKETPIV